MALKSVVGDDGGSANLDCLTISLPRLKEEKVIDAVKKLDYGQEVSKIGLDRDILYLLHMVHKETITQVRLRL